MLAIYGQDIHKRFDSRWSNAPKQGHMVHSDWIIGYKNTKMVEQHYCQPI